MIDVPARVKDALKSGDYRKNYRVLVSVDYPYELKDTVTFSISGTTAEAMSKDFDGFNVGDGCRYKYGEPNAFSSLKIYVLVDGLLKTYTYYAVSSESETYVNFTFLEAFTGQIASIELRGVNVSEPYAFDVELYQNIKTLVIDNNNLVSESVKFDERMCSDSELKFGLCEGTSVEFQYFDKPNIRGEQIKIELDVQYKNDGGNLAWHTIPMGYYEVIECSRQASTGIIKASACNKLQSTYLDADATARISEILASSSGGRNSVAYILATLLNDYSFITSEYEQVPGKIYDAQVSYSSANGARIYTIDGFPYDNEGIIARGRPAGKYFGVFRGRFYYVPQDATSSATNHYYHYEINMPAIWDVVRPAIDKCVQDLAPYHITGDLDIFTNNSYCVQSSGGGYVVPVGDGEFAGSVNVNGEGDYYIQENKEDIITTGDFTNSFPVIEFTAVVTCDMLDFYDTQPTTQRITDYITEQFNEMMDSFASVNIATIYHKKMSSIEEKRLTFNDLDSNNSVTLRDLQSAVFEVNCQYGKLDRVTDLFSGIDLNNGGLYPRDGLYPANLLFPQGISEAGYPAMYNKLWADEGNVRSFKYLYITYKSTIIVDDEEQEVEKTMQRLINADGTDNYNMSNNWLFKNLIWTDQEVAIYANAMAEKMQNIRWFPFEMWCVGLPYLEAGDAIEIKMKEGTYLSYVLRRTLNGIQNLQDEMINGTLDIF